MTTKATVNYHIRSDAAQAFHFDVDGIIGNLIAPELNPVEINVQDLRGEKDPVSFETDGILFTEAWSRTKDFSDESSWQADYEADLQSLLTEKIGAEEVIIFDHTVRVDDQSAERQPARNVHNDYSCASAEQRLIDIVGQQRADHFRSGGFGFVNVWRPVEKVIKTSPLGFIRPGSMKPDDWMTIDLIYPDRRGEILGVAKNLAHEWFYLSHMTPDEVAIFNIYDSKDRPFLAHSALEMAVDEEVQIPRKSIESRTLVRYA